MIGNYTNKLDEKLRLTIPTKFRSELSSIVVLSYGFDNTLELRSLKSFKIWSDSLIEKGNLSSKARHLSRIILGNSFELNIDKAGRILIPKQLLELVDIQKDVVLVGVGEKLEIHSLTQWEKTASNKEVIKKALNELGDALS